MSDKRLCEGGYELPSRDRACERCGAGPKDHCGHPGVDPRDARIAALEARIAEMEWRDIETAPRDGSPFLTYSPPLHESSDAGDSYDIAWWSDEWDGFVKFGCGFDSVTHWKPVEAPK